MTLSPGIRLGFYEIIAPLGKGGMGEVWRAARLGREVAIKTLPPEVARQRIDVVLNWAEELKARVPVK